MQRATIGLSVLAAAILLTVSQVASAQQQEVAPGEGAALQQASEAQPLESDLPEVRPDERSGRSNRLVRIGFDTVEGAPRYAVRSAIEDGPATVRFSSVRPRADGLQSMPDRLPVSNARLTSRYGYRVHPVSGRGSSHHGIDLAVGTGTPVVTTLAGEVAFAGWSGGYGLLVVVDHGGGIETRYGHLSHIGVRSGDGLEQGQIIGRSGSTGRSTGPHVHYEVRVDGRSVDPMPRSAP